MSVKSVMREPTRKRRAQECAQRRTEILDAAERVFATKGYACASMEEVARETDLAVGTLYNFFKNKESLYVEILQQKSGLIGSKIDAVLAREEPAYEKIQSLFRARVEIFWEHPRFFRLFFHHTNNTLCDPRQGMTDDIRARYEAMLEVVTGIFRQGIAEGSFIAIDPELLTLNFEGIIRSYLANLSRRDEQPGRNPEEENVLLNLFLTGAQQR